MQHFFLKAKKAIKKVAAISTGVAMLGATMTGALALDLAEYPGPFIVGGVPDSTMLIALGALSAPQDNIAATNIALGLQDAAKTPASGAGTTVSVVGGETADVPLYKSIAATTTGVDDVLEDDDISTLIDTKISYQSKEYDIREVVLFHTDAGTGPTVQTGLTSPDDDYKDGIYLEIPTRDSIKYYYAFDDAINVSKATTTNPLEIKFLGKTLKITSATNTSITAFVGAEYFMDVGDSVVVEGKTVTLDNVGSGGAIVVSVDGVIETIPASSTETVNGIEISNDETFYEDNKEQRSASLIIGKDAQNTFADGDPYAGGDDICTDNDPDDPDCWVWDLAGLKDVGSDAATTVTSVSAVTGPKIGVENDFVINGDDDKPITVGGCYDLPNNYISICFDSLTVADTDYMTWTWEYESKSDVSDAKSSLAALTQVPSIYVRTSASEGMQIYNSSLSWGNMTTSTIKTSKIWLVYNNETTYSSACNNCTEIYYADSNGKARYAGYINETGAVGGTKSFFVLNYGDTKDANINVTDGVGIPVGKASIDHLLFFEVDINGDTTSDITNGDDNMNISWMVGTGNVSSLGNATSSEETDELVWNNTKIGTKDEDHRTIYGIIVKDPKSNGASDSVVMKIPSDEVQANIVVKGAATSISSGATSYISNPLPDPIVVVESDIAGSESAHNLIVVGGPAVNKLAEKFLGLTADQYRANYKAGEAVLKLVNNGNKVALVVAGYNADDTQRAGKVLQNYGSFNLETTEALVKGTSLNVEDITVV